MNLKDYKTLKIKCCFFLKKRYIFIKIHIFTWMHKNIEILPLFLHMNLQGVQYLRKEILPFF